MTISQSYIKEFLMYLDGNACGGQIEAKYFKGKFGWFVGSGVQGIGTWFEYLCTGAIPKDGKIPLPKLTEKGKKAYQYNPDTKLFEKPLPHYNSFNDGELLSAYKNMIPHVDNFKLTLQHYKIDIIEVGLKLKDGDEEGTTDIIGEHQKNIYGWHEDSGKRELFAKKGDACIIDIKTSGLLDDKWSEYGWNLERLAQKEKLVIQPVHYMYLWEKLYGVKPTFLFFLFNTKDGTDFRILNFVVDDDDIEKHSLTIEGVKKLTKEISAAGWLNRPTTKRCRACPLELRLNCPDYATVPPITMFYYTKANSTDYGRTQV